MAADDNEIKRRVRAARGYMGLERPAFGEALGVSTATVLRMETEDGPARTAKKYLEKIANASSLPVEFFTVDFSRLHELTGEPTPPSHLSLEERVHRIEMRIAAHDAEALAPSDEEASASPRLPLGQQR
jgi:DNA-binding XRE family transcriptional regulator